MSENKKFFRFLFRIVIIPLQIFMTQLVTFLASLLLPGMEDFPQTFPVLFICILGITYTTGVFLVGWLALKWRCLSGKSAYLARLLMTMLGAYLPLLIAFLIYPVLEPGNPFFLIAIITCVIGFYVPEFIPGL